MSAKKKRIVEKIRIKSVDGCIGCPDCGEAFCEEHQMHYADCDCVGPGNAPDLGYEVIEIKGVLYGVKYK